jgi:transposase
MSRRPYTRLFKEQAMKMVTESGYTPTHAARELNIPFSTLILWLKKSGWKEVAPPASQMSDDVKALQARIRHQEEQIRRLEMEKEILKKATAFFASQKP